MDSAAKDAARTPCLDEHTHTPVHIHLLCEYTLPPTPFDPLPRPRHATSTDQSSQPKAFEQSTPSRITSHRRDRRRWSSACYLGHHKRRDVVQSGRRRKENRTYGTNHGKYAFLFLDGDLKALYSFYFCISYSYTIISCLFQHDYVSPLQVRWEEEEVVAAWRAWRCMCFKRLR
jgi:hypothetical protein